MHHLSLAKSPRPPEGARAARRRALSRGFTMAEMLAVLVMIGILTVAASPVFINMMRDRRINSAAMQVVDMYRTARTRALGRGAPVLISWDRDAGQKIGSSGVLTLREPIVQDALEPNVSCTGVSWNDPDKIHTYMQVDFGDGRYERAALSFVDAGAAQPRADICFSSRGRAVLRTGDVFGELTRVPTFTVVNSGTTLQRTIFLPPNGAARLGR